jgi:hypothetical protein
MFRAVRRRLHVPGKQCVAIPRGSFSTFRAIAIRKMSTCDSPWSFDEQPDRRSIIARGERYRRLGHGLRAISVRSAEFLLCQTTGVKQVSSPAYPLNAGDA